MSENNIVNQNAENQEMEAQTEHTSTAATNVTGEPATETVDAEKNEVITES